MREPAALVLLALLALLPAGVVADPALGAAAPSFVLQDARGSELTLETFAGKPRVFNVFASWCPPCRVELPRIVAASKETRGRVAFVGVDEQEPLTLAEPFIRRMALPYPVAFDHGQFAASYGAASLPETVFVDAAGRVRAIVHGEISQAALARDIATITAR